MDLLAQHQTLLIVLAGLFGFLMAFGIGANDVANAMGTSVGSNAITIKQAIVIALIFEVAGAWLAGGEVTDTIRKGIIDPSGFQGGNEYQLVFGMLAALLAAGTWLVIATMKGWPVSTTHSIIGAIIGFSLVSVGSDAVDWAALSGIVGSWVITPVIAGVIAYFIFISVEKLVLNTSDPIRNAHRYVPIYMAMAAFVLSLVTVLKGLKHVGLHLEKDEAVMVSLGIAALVALVGRFVVKRVKVAKNASVFDTVEKIFAILMVVTACCMAFAHGSNDVANSIGPLAAVVSVVQSGGEIQAKTQLAPWILPLGAVGIGAGLAVLGARVISTIGSNITHLTPTRGFAAELAAASTVVIASGTGLPISTTQTLVGAVLGVGMARGVAALNLGMIGKIFASWFITLPAGALLSIVFFWMIKGAFG